MFSELALSGLTAAAAVKVILLPPLKTVCNNINVSHIDNVTFVRIINNNFSENVNYG